MRLSINTREPLRVRTLSVWFIYLVVIITSLFLFIIFFLIWIEIHQQFLSSIAIFPFFMFKKQNIDYDSFGCVHFG